MEKRTFQTVVAVSFAVLVMSQGDLMAQTVSSEILESKLSIIREFIFGTPMKIAAALGFVAGIVKSYTAGSGTPLMIYAGIALCVGLVPTFLDSIFTVSGMLLP